MERRSRMKTYAAEAAPTKCLPHVLDQESQIYTGRVPGLGVGTDGEAVRSLQRLMWARFTNSLARRA